MLESANREPGKERTSVTYSYPLLAPQPIQYPCRFRHFH